MKAIQIFKSRIFIGSVLLLVLGSALAWRYAEHVDALERERERVVGQSILLALNSAHYLDVELNNDFSEKVFEMYIKRLDPTKKFFLQEDIEELSHWKYQVHSLLGQSDMSFFDRSVELIAQRIREAEQYYEEILDAPFDFDKDEEIELDPDNQDFAADREGLKDEWRKALKYQVLVRLNNEIRKQDEALEREDTSYVEKSFEAMEEEAREQVGKRQADYFDNLFQIKRSDRFSAYYNAVASVFGPHSGYYPPKDRENFDIRMSGKLEGIGAQLIRRDGVVQVTSIVPGSASWKQGDLDVDDKILKVAQEDEEPIDVVGMRLDDVVQLIRGEKGTTVTLTVEKVDGNIMEIPIVRDVVVLEETYARSAVLQDEEESYRAGYIYLPRFYVDFRDEDGRNCSEDVEKELIKLNDEGVDGIILDLRNNGGGSLPDVVKIAGYFIDEGPIVQIKGQRGRPNVLRDDSGESLYDGPLVILVNRGSASASEIMAAAMQDYGRAIVAGSNATFGKGTVQRFYDLDQVIRSREAQKHKPMGSVKLTTQKFYRINGGATQLKGVTPHIPLPGRFNYVDVGERDMPHVMPWTKIDSLEYTQKYQGTYHLEKLAKKSKQRIEQNPVFQLIDEDARRVKDNRERTSRTLNLEKFTQEQKDLREASQKLREARNQQRAMNVQNLLFDMQTFEEDTIKKERFTNWIEDLSTDVYLEEALHILMDVEN